MSFKDKMDATTDKIKGKATEAAGRVTGDDEKIAKGKAEQAVADGKKAAGSAKDAVQDLLDK